MVDSKQQTIAIQTPFYTRQTVNSAVFIEKCISASNGNVDMEGQKHVTKKCSCISSSEYCRFHANKPKKLTANSKSLIKSLIQIKPSDSDNGDDFLREWLIKKKEEKRRKNDEEKLVEEANEKERLKRLEFERQNFKMWLEKKKREEIKEKEKSLMKKDMVEKQKEKEMLNRQMENNLKFQLWVKQKERAELEKKLAEEKKEKKIKEEKQRKIEENQKAYEKWLENSKDKPKPLYQGLKRLSLSKSISYINPQPWTFVACEDE